ncbi:MAG: GGDEF domain-containing protein, partial [Haliea sp.]|nr:GGDEF domain-containing protein [Haliea sp.]
MSLSKLPMRYAQADFLNALFDAMPDLYFLLTLEGVIEDFRGGQPEELLVSPEHFLGQSVGDVLPPAIAEQFMQALAKAKESEEVVSFEYQLALGDVETAFEARISALRDHGQAVCVVRNITELREARQQLESMAHYDALTGLANRALLDKLLEQSVRSARRNSQRMGVMFVDLDRFKEVNDTLGHAAGDELLRLVAQRLQRALRESDTLARVGGDEFVVVLDDLDSID